MPPRVTVKELQAALNIERESRAKLQDANEQLKLELIEQARLLRSTAPKSSSSSGRLPESHCPICFEALSDSDPQLVCGHEFCRPCCIKHFQSNTACPLCRVEATPKEIWRFKHPRLAKYWTVLHGTHWPRIGDHAVVTTRHSTIAGMVISVSDDTKVITLLHGSSAWDLLLDNIVEIFTIQYLVEQLPLREDGLVRRISNAT